MADLIKANPIAGDSVYGVQQVEYTVDGVSGMDYVGSVMAASFKQAAAIESATGAYTEVVKERQRKVSDLGEMLSYISKAVSMLPVKKRKSTDQVTVSNAAWIKSKCAEYEISLKWSGDKMTYGDLQKAQTEVQYQMDKEDNNLQQDLVSMQSYITKRDNAYSNASKLVKKTLKAADSTIANMGG